MSLYQTIVVNSRLLSNAFKAVNLSAQWSLKCQQFNYYRPYFVGVSLRDLSCCLARLCHVGTLYCCVRCSDEPCPHYYSTLTTHSAREYEPTVGIRRKPFTDSAKRAGNRRIGIRSLLNQFIFASRLPPVLVAVCLQKVGRLEVYAERHEPVILEHFKDTSVQ